MPSPIATLPGIQKLLQKELAADHPLFATLATVGPNSIASARTIILRGLDTDHDSLWLSSHSHAQKVADLRRNTIGEVTLWLPHRKIQLRLRAAWRIIDTAITARMPALAELRQLAWNTHSPASRLLFLLPNPGQPLEPRARRALLRDLQSAADTPLDTPPPAFTVLLGTLEQIDALHLTTSPPPAVPLHERYLHEKLRTTWRTTPITP